MALPSVTYTFTNGTAADGTQVNTNFTDIINSLTDGTKDLSISALTLAGALTANGSATLGNASADDLTINASLASSIPVKTTNIVDIGAAALGIKSIYFASDDGAGFSCRVIGSTMSASWTLKLPTVDGAAGDSLQTDGSGALSFVGGPAPTAKTTDYTVTTADKVLTVDATAAAFTLTLYAATGNSGRTLRVINIGTTNYVVTIDGNAAETINGDLTVTLNEQWEVIDLVCDGTGWNITNRCVLAELGYKVLRTKHLAETTDLPTETNSYGWRINGSGSFDDGDFVGSKALTENGSTTSILTDASVYDVLGSDTYCYLDGSVYYSSTDAVFDSMVNSFTVMGWFYAADWTTGATRALISKSDAANGWSLSLSTANSIIMYNYTAAANDAIADTLGEISPGWHHIAMARDDGTSTAIYLDGNHVAYTDTHENITDAGNLEIAGVNGGNSKFTGGIQSVIVNTTTAFSADQVKKIYSAQCKAFAIQLTDANTKVSILDGRRINGIIKTIPTATYTVTTSLVDATGHELHVPKDCYGTFICEGGIACKDNDSTTQLCYVALAVDGTPIESTYRAVYMISGANADLIYLPYHIEYTGHFSKDAKLTLQAKMAVGDNCEILYVNNDTEPFVQLNIWD